MARRRITSFVSLAVVSLLIAASFIATNEAVKIVLFLSILIMATALIVAYIFQGRADFEALQAEEDQLRAESEADRALAAARAGRVEVRLEYLKRDLYSELAVRSMALDDSGFSDAMNQLLIESVSSTEPRDG